MSTLLLTPNGLSPDDPHGLSLRRLVEKASCYCVAHSMIVTIIRDRDDPIATQARACHERAPFHGAALPAAGHRQHIQIAEEAFFEIGVGAVNHVRQCEFHDEDASIVRQ